MRNGVSLWCVVGNPVHYGLNVNKGTATKLLQFHGMISSFAQHLETEDAYTLGAEIIQQSGIYKDLYSESTPEALARQENLEEFLSGMQEFVEAGKEEDRADGVSLISFLQEVSLLTDLDSDDDKEKHRVSLMTVHSAKGLEFPTVFVVGLEENIFPSPMATGSKRELEEERRLLYVAITRAERHCILTCARNRYRYGKMEFDTPSRFISDIDPKLLKVEENGEPTIDTFRSNRGMQNSRPVASQFVADPKPRITGHREEPPADPFSSRFKRTYVQSGGNLRRLSDALKSPVGKEAPTAKPALSEGNVIEHERFGIGNVLRAEGTGENTKATVQFRNAGTKQLLLKFARYKIIG